MDSKTNLAKLVRLLRESRQEDTLERSNNVEKKASLVTCMEIEELVGDSLVEVHTL